MRNDEFVKLDDYYIYQSIFENQHSNDATVFFNNLVTKILNEYQSNFICYINQEEDKNIQQHIGINYIIPIGFHNMNVYIGKSSLIKLENTLSQDFPKLHITDNFLIFGNGNIKCFHEKLSEGINHNQLINLIISSGFNALILIDDYVLKLFFDNMETYNKLM